MAELALDGDVDAEALGEGGAGLDDVTFAEFGPFGAAEGAFDDEVVQDGPAAGSRFLWRKLGRGIGTSAGALLRVWPW